MFFFDATDNRLFNKYQHLQSHNHSSGICNIYLQPFASHWQALNTLTCQIGATDRFPDAIRGHIVVQHRIFLTQVCQTVHILV